MVQTDPTRVSNWAAVVLVVIAVALTQTSGTVSAFPPGASTKETIYVSVVPSHYETTVYGAIANALGNWYHIELYRMGVEANRMMRVSCNYDIKRRDEQKSRYEHRVRLDVYYRGEEFVGTSSRKSNERTEYQSPIIDAVQEIIPDFRKKFPVTSRIILIEGNEVTVDMGEAMGAKVGGSLAVLSDTGEKLARLKITSVGLTESRAKILSGRGRFQEGDLVEEYAHLQGHFRLAYEQLNTNIERNPNYAIAPEENEQLDFTTGHLVTLGMTFAMRGSPSWKYGTFGGEAATGYLDLGVVKCWQVIDLTGIWVKEWMTGRIVSEIGLGGGLAITGQMDWAKPPDVQTNSSTPSDTTGTMDFLLGGLTTYLRAHVFLSDNVSVFAQAGYRYYDRITNLSEWKSDNEAINEVIKETPEIPDEWLKYDLNNVRGWSFGFGISWWRQGFWF